MVKAPLTANILDCTAQGQTAWKLLADISKYSLSFSVAHFSLRLSLDPRAFWRPSSGGLKLGKPLFLRLIEDCLNYGTQCSVLTLTVFWHLACSTHQPWKQLLHIPDIVNYDGAEHRVTKLLTQRDTSSDNKAGRTVGLDSWLTVGGKWKEVGNNTGDMFSRWVSNGCSI